MNAVNILSQNPTARWDVTVKARLRPNSITHRKMNWQTDPRQSWVVLLQPYSVLYPISSLVFSSTFSTFSSSTMTDSSISRWNRRNKHLGQNPHLGKCYTLSSLELVQRPSICKNLLVNKHISTTTRLANTYIFVNSLRLFNKSSIADWDNDRSIVFSWNLPLYDFSRGSLFLSVEIKSS